MYSLMSSTTRASSSPNMNSASVLATSVLPTPLGPQKMNEPIGRFGSFSPARARRIALLIALIASSWLMIFLCSSASSSSSRLASSLSIRFSGTPVILLTTSLTTSSSTMPPTSLVLSRHCRWIVSFSRRMVSALSRSSAAFS